MQEKEQKFQRKNRELQLKEAEGRLQFKQNTQQKMEESFHYLNRFLESARSFYDSNVYRIC